MLPVLLLLTLGTLWFLGIFLDSSLFLSMPQPPSVSFSCVSLFLPLTQFVGLIFFLACDSRAYAPPLCLFLFHSICTGLFLSCQCVADELFLSFVCLFL